MTDPAGSASQSQQVQDFDVCVIGAGAAGLLITEVLSRDPSLRICLLEAGPDHFRDRKEPYYVRSLVKEHKGVNEGRVTAFGGATNTWGGGLIRLSAADFAALDGRPDTAWPIAFESLVPHYEAVEAMFDFQAAPETPQDVVISRPDFRAVRRDIYCLSFRSKNFAHYFGPTVRGRSNVTLLCDATISTIHPASDGSVSRLDVNIRNQPSRTIAARHFIVTAGTVNSNYLATRFLDACGRRQSAPDCGCYFHDHISFPIARLWPKSQLAFSRRFGYRFRKHLMLGEHFDFETSPSHVPGAFLHLAFDTTDSSLLRPIRVVLNAIQQRTLRNQQWFSFRELLAMIVGVPLLGYMRYIHGRLYLDPGTKVLATLDLEQLPVKSWKLERRGDDHTATWDLSPEDAATAARFIPACREILAKLKNDAEFRVEELAPDPAKDYKGFVEYMNRTLVDTLHGGGGLRMGTDPAAPVDPELRLNGIKNTYVVSSAVFPRVGTSNPTLTILALGHRLAQQIMSSLKSK